MSRRDQIRMSDQEAWDFVRASKTLILNSIGPGGFPHPMPMWFSVDAEGAIRMTTFRKSQKVKNIRRDPRVSLLVESGEEYAELKSVVLYGRAEIIDDLGTVLDTLMAAAGGAADPEARRAQAEELRGTAAKRVCIRVVPERIVSWDHAKLGGAY